MIATTTIGTTTSDFFDRTAGLGYVKSSVILLATLIAIFVVLRLTKGSIAAVMILLVFFVHCRASVRGIGAAA